MLVNAVKSLDVMDPSRSTLNENIGPCASIHLNSILADLNELCWQECCVTSVDVFNNTEVSQASNASASMPWCHGFENSEIPIKWLTKRKRSETLAWLFACFRFDWVCLLSHCVSGVLAGALISANWVSGTDEDAWILLQSSE